MHEVQKHDQQLGRWVREQRIDVVGYKPPVSLPSNTFDKSCQLISFSLPLNITFQSFSLHLNDNFSSLFPVSKTYATIYVTLTVFRYMWQKLSSVGDNLDLLGPPPNADGSNRSPLVSFNR